MAFSLALSLFSHDTNLLTSAGIDGLLTQMSILGAEDSLTFEAFIATKLAPKLWIGAYVFMDNCSIHKGENIEALIAVSGVTLIYLPPYSPDFHQLRIVGQRFKSILRSIGARNYPDLLKSLEDAFNSLSTSDFQSWFTHSCYCTSLN